MSQKISKVVFLDNIVKRRIPKWRMKVVGKDDDMVMLIDGREGCGKSVFGQQLASNLDPEFNIDKIVFNSEQFIKAIRSPIRKKGDCILLDEAFSSVNARASLSRINRAMVATATEMRQLNLFVIIILPSFFDLDRYFALHRCDVLFHVYFNKKGRRGQYIIFPYNMKKKLYLNGKKTYSYGVVKSPYPPCKFPDGYVVDEDEYRSKKKQSFVEKPVESRLETRYKLRLIALINHLRDEFKQTDEEIGKLLGMERSGVNLLRRGRSDS